MPTGYIKRVGFINNAIDSYVSINKFEFCANFKRKMTVKTNDIRDVTSPCTNDLLVMELRLQWRRFGVLFVVCGV